MTAGLQRDISCCATGIWPSQTECARFCVGLARSLMPAFAQNFAPSGDDAPHPRVGMRGIATTPGKLHRPRHKRRVLSVDHACPSEE